MENTNQNKNNTNSTVVDNVEAVAEDGNVELNLCKKQAEEYLNNWKRERADFMNYKKDEAKRMSEFVKFANEPLILEIIESLDDLELAQEDIKNDGLSGVIKKFKNVLKKYGVEEIEIEGKQFDPNLHEQVFADSGESLQQGAYSMGNMQKVRSGYTMNGRVMRVARVRMLGSKIN